MSRRKVSSDGVPNRKGGSWPNHSAMRYELPVPFSPGAENVTDSYREGYCRTFGCRPGCGHDAPAPEHQTFRVMCEHCLDVPSGECPACARINAGRP